MMAAEREGARAGGALNDAESVRPRHHHVRRTLPTALHHHHVGRTQVEAC